MVWKPFSLKYRPESLTRLSPGFSSTWPKITVIDETLGKLTVAAWIGATPADGTTFQIVQYDYFSTGATTYTATTVTEAGSPDLSNAKINQRIYSTKLGTNPPKEVYARITFVDDTTDTITVDEWIGGTPTNGQGFFVSGWIADLPRTQELTEHWEQDALTHSLLRHRKVSKYFGWYYSCTLDYSKYAPGDLFVRLRHHLNMKGEDRLVLIPRRDAEQFQYTVRFAAGFDVSMLGEGLANRKPVFVFESTETVSNFNLVLSGWGRSYAQDYGNGSS